MSAATAGKVAASNGAAANPKGAAARRVIDLDKARAARAELAEAPPAVRLGGHDYDLPAELPLAFVELAQRGQIMAAGRALFGDEQMDSIVEIKPPLSVEDFTELFDQVNGVYGVAEGDSPASAGS